MYGILRDKKKSSYSKWMIHISGKYMYMKSMIKVVIVMVVASRSRKSVLVVSGKCNIHTSSL